jgi:hypothetical protein
MTDRIKGFTITLQKDIRDDDMNQILTTLKMIKYVVDVEPVIFTGEDRMAEQRLKAELRGKVYEFLKENL